MNNKNFKLAFRALFLIIAIVAFIFTFTDHYGAGSDHRPTTLFYTTWSVWFALASAIFVCVLEVLTIVKKKEIYTKWCTLLEFCALIMMIATFIVSAFVLPEKIWTADYWTAGSVFKHFLLPILTVIDVVLFEKKNKYTLLYPIYGVIPSLVYWAIVIIRALIKRGGKMINPLEWPNYYPYGFTNFDNGHSVGGLIGLLAGIMAGLILIGYGFWFIKCKLQKNENN